jgi:hypothetical protein
MLVIAAGLVSFGVVSRAQPDPNPQPVAPPIVATSSNEVQVVEIPGVDGSIQRLLFENGEARVYPVESLTQIPESIRRVLTAYGVPLLAPVLPDPFS